MGKTCCAYGCHGKFIKGGPLTFHTFPKNQERRELWEKRLCRKDFKASDSSLICSKHFTADCFDQNKFGGTWLKSDAVPTIFDFSEQQSKNSRRKLLNGNYKEMQCNRYKKRKTRCYFVEDGKTYMHSPATAIKVLQRAREEITKKKKKIKALTQHNKRLGERIATLQQRFNKMKKSSPVTNTASDVLENSETVGNEGKEESPIQPTVQIEEKNPSPVEPTVKIKEEPADDYPTPSTSKDTPGGEFILPDESDSWTSSASVVEPQFTLSVASLALPNEPETSAGGEQPKEKQRTNSSDLTTPVSTPNDTKVEPQTTVHNLEEKSNPETSKDNLDAFGEYVVTRLRRFDQVLSSCTKAAIRNVLLQAEMSTYLNQTKDANS